MVELKKYVTNVEMRRDTQTQTKNRHKIFVKHMRDLWEI